MGLTDVKIRNAKAKLKPYKLSDEKGLYLLITPQNAKYWRLKYRFLGKEKALALGVYPEVSLADARDKRDNARKQLTNDIDPGIAKKVARRALETAGENTFEAVGREWFAKYSARWVKSYSSKILGRLESDIFPWLGKSAISEITAPQLLSVLRRIENRGTVETAHRNHQYCSRIFRYGIATGRCERDPAADLRGALPPAIVKHRPTILEPLRLGELLRAIQGYRGYWVTKCALELAPLVFVRPGELRYAEWSEINLETAEWHIAAEKMKMRQPHIVPLSKQAIRIIEELRPLTGQDKYLFTGCRMKNRPISDNTLNAALRQLGYDATQLTAHGFRATARTLLDEILKFRPDIIEHQLAHAVKDPNGRAYNRTSHLEDRREMMQKWADYLDALSKKEPLANHF